MIGKVVEEKVDDEHLQKRLKITLGTNDAVYLLWLRDKQVGTAFSIDDTHILTARHNLFDDNLPHDPSATSIQVSLADALFSTVSMIPLKVACCPDPVSN